MRPVTLNVIIKMLKRIKQNNSIRINELKTRDLEIIHFLDRTKLILKEGNEIKISKLGEEFLSSYENRNIYSIHNILYNVLPEYKIVYIEYVKKPSTIRDIIERTGYNIVVVDNMLRLINEIENLSNDESIIFINKNNLKNLFFKKYYELVRKERNRYVKLTHLENELKKEVFLTRKLFIKLLMLLIKQEKDRIILVGMPYVGKDQGVYLNGKRYVYVMLR